MGHYESHGLNHKHLYIRSGEQQSIQREKNSKKEWRLTERIKWGKVNLHGGDFHLEPSSLSVIRLDHEMLSPSQSHEEKTVTITQSSTLTQPEC